jgi:hypothetical protein
MPAPHVPLDADAQGSHRFSYNVNRTGNYDQAVWPGKLAGSGPGPTLHSRRLQCQMPDVTRAARLPDLIRGGRARIVGVGHDHVAGDRKQNLGHFLHALSRITPNTMVISRAFPSSGYAAESVERRAQAPAGLCATSNTYSGLSPVGRDDLEAAGPMRLANALRNRLRRDCEISWLLSSGCRGDCQRQIAQLMTANQRRVDHDFCVPSLPADNDCGSPREGRAAQVLLTLPATPAARRARHSRRAHRIQDCVSDHVVGFGQLRQRDHNTARRMIPAFSRAISATVSPRYF